METILTQKFTFASITPYRDYSKLSQKKFSTNTFDIDESYDVGFVFGEKNDDFDNLKSFFKEKNGKVFTLPEKPKNTKRRTHFFYDDSEIQEKFKIDFLYKNPESDYTFDTTKDHQIKRHFGKPFSAISIQTIERSIRKHDDKVTIKIYHGYKSRMFNSIYFTKSFYVISLTINLKTGNFTLLEKQKSGKKNNQKFVTNGFQTLHNSLTKSQSFFNPMKSVLKTSRLYDEISETFNNVEFSNKIQESLGFDYGCINYSNNPERFNIDLMDMFIKKKNIKIPDGEISYWFYRFYPTEKYLKKNDRKLFASILDMLGIKTKITVKILHINPNIEIEGFVRFCKLLGSDYSKYIGNLNDELIRNSNRQKSINGYYDGVTKTHLLNKDYQFNFQLNDLEKENIIRILNSSLGFLGRHASINGTNAFSGETFRLFEDHFNMIKKIKQYDPDIQMRARTVEEFGVEHREFSKILSAIKKGWVIEYVYDDDTLKIVEEPLEFVYDNSDEIPTINGLARLYPRVLKREEEYVEEGAFMHHCVATYSDKDKSMIISVRNENGTDRVTCEFEIQSGRCVQQRYFCNGVPPEYFKDALLLLEDRILKRARWGLLNWKEKQKVPVMINGKPIFTEEKIQRVTDIFEGHRLPF